MSLIAQGLGYDVDNTCLFPEKPKWKQSNTYLQAA